MAAKSSLGEYSKAKAKEERLQSLYGPSLHKNKSSTKVHYMQLYNITSILLIPVNSAV